MDRDLAAPNAAFPDTIRQGDVFWIEADPSRGSIPGSPHPHVVVQEDVFNQSRISTVIVCALTSTRAYSAWDAADIQRGARGQFTPGQLGQLDAQLKGHWVRGVMSSWSMSTCKTSASASASLAMRRASCPWR
jgi:mRNA-degrading endonuclease toxin of MazEF toxin-antitoxin module